MNARISLRIFAALCFGLTTIALHSQPASQAKPQQPNSPVSPAIKANYDKLPLSFEQNVGQTASNVQWLARSSGSTLYLSGTDATVQINHIDQVKQNGIEVFQSRNASLRMSLLHAQPARSSEGEVPQSGKANYFTGKDSSRWQKDVPLYGQVRLDEVYPGVSLLYHGERGQLEYDFVVAPNADPARIALGFTGATPSLAANGDLLLPILGDATVRFDKPVVYQMNGSVRSPVESSYQLASDGHVSFHLGAYDHSRELVIDPKLIFLGTMGAGNYPHYNEVSQITVDSTGALYFIGTTNDPAYPITLGSYQQLCGPAEGNDAKNGGAYCSAGGGSTSAYVSKISADGTTLVYSTYLSGHSGYEQGTSIAVDAAGVAYLLGATASTDFPITSDAFQSQCQPISASVLGPPIPAPVSQCDNFGNGGGTEYTVNGPVFFFAKLSADGSSLIYSSFLGGSYFANPVATALDSSGNWYLYGQTGVDLAKSLYTGSNGTGERVQFPGVSSTGYQTVSTAYYNTTLNQLTDPEAINSAAVLSKFSNDGHTLLYGTFFGDETNGYDFNPTSFAVGANGIAFIGGWSSASAMPTTTGAVKTGCTVASNAYTCTTVDGYVVAFDTTKSGASSLVYSTRIGGSAAAQGSNIPNQEVLGVGADSNNDAYVTGYTYDQTFPVPTTGYMNACAAVNPSNTNNCDAAFVLELNPAGTSILAGSFLSGPAAYAENSIGYKVLLDSKNQVYLYGISQDGQRTFPTVNPVQALGNGGNALYIATMSHDLTKLLFSTRFGNPNLNGSNVTPVNGLALDPSGNIYFAGTTNDQTFAATTGTYTTSAAQGTDPHTFFGKISPVLLASATTLALSPTSTTADQPVGFNITVAGTTGAAAPTGSVDLNYTTSANSTPTLLQTVQLDGTGTGTYTTTSLGAGTYTFTAVYSGDTNYDISASTAQTLTIAAAAPATKTVASISPASGLVYGQSATLSAAVTLTGGTGTPSGSVAFSEGSISLGTGTLNGSGVATVQAVLPAGTGAITAVYAGTSTDPGSTGTSATFTVAQAPLTVTAANATRVAGTANPTFTGTVTGVVNNDSLTASYSSTATASSAVGTYPVVPSITGANIGDYNVTLVNGTLTITTAPPASDFSIALTPTSATVTDGASTSATVTITPINGFNSATSLSCLNLPANTTCSFNPASVTPNGAAATSTLTISTKGATAAGIWPLADPSSSGKIKWTMYAISIISLALIGWIGFTTRKIRREWIRYVALLILSIAFAGGVLGCGSSIKETQSGTYAITVQATSGSTTHTAIYNMTVNQ